MLAERADSGQQASSSQEESRAWQQIAASTPHRLPSSKSKLKKLKKLIRKVMHGQHVMCTELCQFPKRHQRCMLKTMRSLSLHHAGRHTQQSESLGVGRAVGCQCIESQQARHIFQVLFVKTRHFSVSVFEFEGNLNLKPPA